MESSIKWKSARRIHSRILAGDFSLPVAFFAIGVTGLALLAVWNLAPASIAEGQAGNVYTAIFTPFVREVFTLVGLMLILNCVWRSAARYDGDTQWAKRAKLAIVAGAASVSLVCDPGWPQRWASSAGSTWAALQSATHSEDQVAMAQPTTSDPQGLAADKARDGFEASGMDSSGMRRLTKGSNPSTKGPWTSVAP